MNKEIFIIDDDLIYRMIVSRAITKIDANIKINQCENGRLGLEMLVQRTEGAKIIILLDINMPVLDGWGFLEEIKKNNFYNIQDPLIYVVSSSTDESDLLKAKQYDFLGSFLHKPLNREDITTIINAC
jgi:CheY-like chemotaxis protein